MARRCAARGQIASWVALATIAIADVAGAQGDPTRPVDPRAVQPERPTVATHAGTVAAGYLEIEVGLERQRFASDTIAIATPTVFKFGVGRRMQLSVLGAVVSSDSGTGVSDLAVGFKWRLLDHAPVLGDFAVLPSIKFPSGSLARGTGTNTTDVGLLLISSYRAGNVAIDLNAGAVRRSGDGTSVPRTATIWTASFGGPAWKSVGWVAEVFGYPGTGGPAASKGTAALLAGPTFLLADYLQLDAGFVAPVTGPQPRILYVGAVYNVGKLR